MPPTAHHLSGCPSSFIFRRICSTNPLCFFQKLVLCITVATAPNFSARRALRGSPVSLNDLPLCHTVVGCISANYEHNPTLNNMICTTGCSERATICRQKWQQELIGSPSVREDMSHYQRPSHLLRHCSPHISIFKHKPTLSRTIKATSHSHSWLIYINKIIIKLHQFLLGYRLWVATDVAIVQTDGAAVKLLPGPQL